MEVEKIKLHKVLTCKDSENASEISKKLKDAKERRIFVIDGDEKILGIITTTDLVYKVLGEDSKGVVAKEIMTSDVKSVDIKEDLNKALEIMNELNSFVCPITDKGKIKGIISYHDLVGYLFKSMQE